jgi:hypothetical protein
MGSEEGEGSRALDDSRDLLPEEEDEEEDAWWADLATDSAWDPVGLAEASGAPGAA